MPGKLVATVKKDINASKERVWKALTDPSLVKKYFFGTNVSSDWKVGSRIIFSGEWQGKKYEDHGNILACEPGKILTYSYWSSMSGTEDIPENYNQVTYALEEKNGVTTLTIIQDGIATEEAKKHSEQNWGMVLDGLAKVAEG